MTKSTTTNVRCVCRHLEHKPTDCPYEAGCSGCMCDRPDHAQAHSTWCWTCEHWTVHPDKHRHDIPSSLH